MRPPLEGRQPARVNHVGARRPACHLPAAGGGRTDGLTAHATALFSYIPKGYLSGNLSSNTPARAAMALFSLDSVQWPAMAVTVAASWFVASSDESRRKVGFWLFLLSNLLWVIWGVHSHAYALVALQVCLVLMNIRGAKRNTDDKDAS
jgi:hypothetical protein